MVIPTLLSPKFKPQCEILILMRRSLSPHSISLTRPPRQHYHVLCLLGTSFSPACTARFSSSPKPLKHWDVPGLVCKQSSCLLILLISCSLMASNTYSSALFSECWTHASSCQIYILPYMFKKAFKTNILKIQHAMLSLSQKYTLANHPHLSKCQLRLCNCSGQNPWRHP